MLDKIQKIKQEIERLDEEYRTLRVEGTAQQAKEADLVVHVLQKLENIIDSLPAEPASEDLDFLVISLEETIGTSPHSREVIKEHMQKAAEWQKQQLMKDAVEGEVVYQIGSAEIAPTDIQYKVVSDRVYIPNVKLGDKVKIIIIKPEQK